MDKGRHSILSLPPALSPPAVTPCSTVHLDSLDKGRRHGIVQAIDIPRNGIAHSDHYVKSTGRVGVGQDVDTRKVPTSAVYWPSW